MKLGVGMFFQAVMAMMLQTGTTNRQQRMHDRLAIKRGRHSSVGGRTMRWYEKRNRARKAARLARRKNRQVRARA